MKSENCILYKSIMMRNNAFHVSLLAIEPMNVYSTFKFMPKLLFTFVRTLKHKLNTIGHCPCSLDISLLMYNLQRWPAFSSFPDLLFLARAAQINSPTQAIRITCYLKGFKCKISDDKCNEYDQSIDQRTHTTTQYT